MKKLRHVIDAINFRAPPRNLTSPVRAFKKMWFMQNVEGHELLAQAVASKTVDILQLRDVISWQNFRSLLEFLRLKATRGHPLSKAEQQTNHRISQMRVRVEPIFARVAQIGGDLRRSIGLKRATQYNHLNNPFITWNATPA
jgi:hypothetical protein